MTTTAQRCVARGGALRGKGHRAARPGAAASAGTCKGLGGVGPSALQDETGGPDVRDAVACPWGQTGLLCGAAAPGMGRRRLRDKSR